jgi:hypothetical protein
MPIDVPLRIIESSVETRTAAAQPTTKTTNSVTTATAVPLEQQSTEASPFDTETLAEFYQNHCTYLPAMLGWFLFSALLSTFNKWVFGDSHNHFPCPLFLTSIHFFIQWIVSFTLSELFPDQLGTSRVKRMNWKEWLSISVPCGIVTAFDIGLSK